VHASAQDLPFAVLWLAWLAYWTIAAWNVKPTRRCEPGLGRLIVMALTLLAAALLAFRSHATPWLNRRFLPETPAAYWIGLLLLAAGLAFAVWARVHLGRNWSGSVTVKQSHELIRSGPYALVRHPIYTGLLTAILGTAIALGEWRGLLAFAILTVAFLLKIKREEHFMSEIFLNEYPRYRADVPALIPFLRRRR
jgi:protein-S-isoprenylcysteine O-methyltransferase Ste14